MRNTKKLVSALFLIFILVFSFTGCGKTANEKLWESATYTTDQEMGQGSRTFYLEVKVLDHQVTFTIHTDKQSLGEALLEQNLIAGEDSQYGLYVKTVNGMIADYDVDKSYWGFYIEDELAPLNVDATDITEGTVYQLVYEY